MVSNESNLKAVASFTIDNVFVIHDVRVIEGTNGNFIAMPSKKAPSGEYRDIVHPITTDMREQLQSAILAKYEEFLASEPTETED